MKKKNKKDDLTPLEREFVVNYVLNELGHSGPCTTSPDVILEPYSVKDILFLLSDSENIDENGIMIDYSKISKKVLKEKCQAVNSLLKKWLTGYEEWMASIK